MKTVLLAAIAALVLPAAAYAQSAPAPEPQAKKGCCCEEMKKDGKDCCAEMKGDHADHDAHAGHDMQGMDHK
jgi:hypothetical protein